MLPQSNRHESRKHLEAVEQQAPPMVAREYTMVCILPRSSICESLLQLEGWWEELGNGHHSDNRSLNVESPSHGFLAHGCLVVKDRRTDSIKKVPPM